MLKFKITPEMEEKIRKEAEELANNRIDDLILKSVSAYFGNGYRDPRHTQPVAYLLINEIVSKVLESEGMQARIEKRVIEKLEAAVDAAADAVVTHHTKKAAFQAAEKQTTS